MTTGMEGFAAQAGALAGQAQGLRAAVDSGHLVMDPEAAKRVARVYEEKAKNLAKLTARTDQLVANGAFGDCFIGQDIERKFQEKALNNDSGAVPLLVKMEGILKNMAQTYRDSAKDMQNTDDDNARNLGRGL